MIALLVNLLIVLLILGLVYYVGQTLLGWISAAAELRQIFHVVFVVICAIVLISFLLHVLGGQAASLSPWFR